MTIWISHRGIRHNCSENSETAFRLASTAGFSWLETDLRCSLDGTLVLSHDASLKRIFGIDGLIGTMSISDLKQIRDCHGEGLFLFSEFVERYSDCGWVLDIKNETAEQVISSLVSNYSDLINGRLKDKIKFLFWHSDHQKHFLSFFPDADCFAQEKECWRAGIAALIGLSMLGGFQSQKTYSLPPRFLGMSLYQSRIFGAYISSGSKVLAYLPENSVHAKPALGLNCDYILANSYFFNSK